VSGVHEGRDTHKMFSLMRQDVIPLTRLIFFNLKKIKTGETTNFSILTYKISNTVHFREHHALKTAFAMSLALWCGNYINACALLPRLSPLLMCVAAQQLPLIRR
jgi:hypothetical protein